MRPLRLPFPIQGNILGLFMQAPVSCQEITLDRETQVLGDSIITVSICAALCSKGFARGQISLSQCHVRDCTNEP